MKYKVMAIAILATVIYSCASKSTVPTTDVKKEQVELKKDVVIATVLTPELAEGKSLYENNCAKCHRLYEPKSFSSEEWKPIVASMQKRAHLDDLQGQKILNYVTMK